MDALSVSFGEMTATTIRFSPGFKQNRIQFDGLSGADQKLYRIATKRIVENRPENVGSRYAVLEVNCEGRKRYAVVNRNSLKKRFKLEGNHVFNSDGTVSAKALTQIHSKLNMPKEPSGPDSAKTAGVEPEDKSEQIKNPPISGIADAAVRLVSLDSAQPDDVKAGLKFLGICNTIANKNEESFGRSDYYRVASRYARLSQLNKPWLEPHLSQLGNAVSLIAINSTNDESESDARKALQYLKDGSVNEILNLTEREFGLVDPIVEEFVVMCKVVYQYHDPKDAEAPDPVEVKKELEILHRAAGLSEGDQWLQPLVTELIGILDFETVEEQAVEASSEAKEMGEMLQAGIHALEGAGESSLVVTQKVAKFLDLCETIATLDSYSDYGLAVEYYHDLKKKDFESELLEPLKPLILAKRPKLSEAEARAEESLRKTVLELLKAGQIPKAIDNPSDPIEDRHKVGEGLMRTFLSYCRKWEYDPDIYREVLDQEILIAEFEGKSAEDIKAVFDESPLFQS